MFQHHPPGKIPGLQVVLLDPFGLGSAGRDECEGLKRAEERRVLKIGGTIRYACGPAGVDVDDAPEPGIPRVSRRPEEEGPEFRSGSAASGT